MLSSKQALVKGAPPTLFMLMSGKMTQDHGILFSSGDIWKETRRFTLRALRDLGFGKMQEDIGILNY